MCGGLARRPTPDALCGWCGRNSRVQTFPPRRVIDFTFPDQCGTVRTSCPRHPVLLYVPGPLKANFMDLGGSR